MDTVKKSIEIIGMVIDLFLGEDTQADYLQKVKDEQRQYL